MWLRRFLSVLEAQILPKTCVFCGVNREGDEEYICVGCHADLPWAGAARVPLAGTFDHLVAPLRYEFPVDASIKAFKFKRKLYYGPAFAEILCEASELLPDDIDAVLPVPLHWRRKAFRGFNQALEIAKPVARKLELPLLRHVYRKRATPFQSGLVARDRHRNLRHAFEIKAPVPCAHVLIVDDVVTTGVTVTALAKVLQRNGVNRVSVLAIARSGAA